MEFNLVAIRIDPIAHNTAMVVTGIVGNEEYLYATGVRDYPADKLEEALAVELVCEHEMKCRQVFYADRSESLDRSAAGFALYNGPFAAQSPCSCAGAGLLEDTFVAEKNTRPPSLRAFRKIAGYVFSAHSFCFLGSALAS